MEPRRVNKGPIHLLSLAVLLALAGAAGCAKPTPTATPVPTSTPAPTATATATQTATNTWTPTPTLTFTPSPTATPTMCSAQAALTTMSGVQVVEISSKELANQFPKGTTQAGVKLESISTAIHPDGIRFAARVQLEGMGVLTATTSMLARAEEGTLRLLPGDIAIEGAADPLTEALALAYFQQLLTDPQWTHVTLPYGRASCVEMKENHLLIAVLFHTPTPTRTPLSPHEIATMFPTNPVYALRSMARAGADMVLNTILDRDTNLLLGLEGRITFPQKYSGSVRDLLLKTLDTVLTQGMVLRQQNAEQGLEVYCNCILGLKLGDMAGDVCWSAGRQGGIAEGQVFTRLNVIKPRVSPRFYEILADWERQRP